MKVINQTRKTVLAEKIVEPKTLVDQSLGLLKYKTPTPMLLKTRYGIHTFGMHYPIDVVILDKQNKVTTVKKKVKPNRIFVWDIHYETVLELPAGTIEKTKTEIGDSINLNKE
jgi:uncharacterized protein